MRPLRLPATLCAALIAVVALPSLAASRICATADTVSFGERHVGTTTTASVDVSNCGDHPFSFTDVSPHAATNAAFHIDTACVTGMTLEPGDACAVRVSFVPAQPGQVSGALWLRNTTDTPDRLVTFYGRGVDAQAGTASIEFSPAVADFGEQQVGVETRALPMTLRKTGMAPLVPSALVLNGADPYDFRGAGYNTPATCGVGKAIPAGAACKLELYFKPRAPGVRQAHLVVDAPQLATLAVATLTGIGTGQPAPAANVEVIEFHNRSDDQYFITADAAEIALLDGGGLGRDWSRTGQAFAAFARDAADPRALPVCRFFGVPGFGPESHFNTAYASECAAVRADPHWIEEGSTFRAMLPLGGRCADDAQSVWRFWKPGSTVMQTRHRYVADAAIASTMQAAGWVAEGPVFCAPR